ncbi:hypothetical protein T484DRAFT_1755028 [Baffinella frigidus]|nr:hypothetical protein T484DRAFT_1755028 [Cryptophyta sp. CCMP2293]
MAEEPMSFGGGCAEPVMTDEQRLVVHVRTVLCGTECFPNYEIDCIVRRFKCGVSAAQNGRMTTWVPANSLPVLLVGTAALGNLVVLCRTGIAYAMSPGVEIPPLASGVVLVGNCTLNYDDTFRLLLYDAENLPSNGGVDVAAQPSSVQRYDRLRSFFPRYFECSEAARNTFVLQWVGHYEHAAKFLTGEINVGHAIGGLVSTTDDALTPTRPVRVQIPSITIKRFQEKQ